MARPKSAIDRNVLLATVSSVALALSWGPQARAADINFPVGDTTYQPSGSGAVPYVWVSLEGRYNMFTDSEIFGYPRFPVSWDPDDGWSGGLEIGVRPAGSAWDYVGRFIYGKANGQDSYTYCITGYGCLDPTAGSVEEEHIIADFEVGRHIGVGLLGGDIRIHAGVRFAHFDASLDGPSFVRQQVTAAGPRIGIDQTVPLGGNFSLDLGAAGAVLFGQRDSVGIYSYSDDVKVWNAEASGGLTWHFGHGAATLGYRIDAFWDLYRDLYGGTLTGGDRITHGPFAKVRLDLSGTEPGGGGAGSGYASGESAFDGSNASPYVWASLEGRHDRFTDSQIFEFPGYSANWDPNDGWSGGLELGARPAGNAWDYVGQIIYGSADGEAFNSYFGFAGSVDEEHIIADFEVGRHIGVGLLGGDTRVHGGVRFAHFDAGFEPYYYQQRITAIGPRIGIDQTIPLGSSVSVDLGAAGAVLFGQWDGSNGSSSYSDDVTVWNAEASGGLTWHFGHGAATLGYRIDAFWDLYRDLGAFSFTGGDRITHGPFAKVTVDLAGSGN